MKKPNFINFLRKKLFKVYISDLIFFSLLLWFLVYARNRIFSYLLVIQQFAPNLADIGSTLAADDASSVAQLDALLMVIEPVVSEAKFFIFFVVPVMIFLLWVLFQGLSWNLLKEDSLKKSLHFNFYPKFALFSMPLFAVVFYLFSDFLSFAEQVNLTKSITLWIILLVVLYFTIVSYLVFGGKKVMSGIYNFGVKKAVVFFPAFLLFLVFLLLVFIFFVNVYISALALAVPSFLSLVLLLFSILLFSSSKCLLVFLSE